MSVTQIKDELPRLSVQEREEIARALLALKDSRDAGAQPAANFAEAKAYVFDNYGELLRRLAQ